MFWKTTCFEWRSLKARWKTRTSHSTIGGVWRHFDLNESSLGVLWSQTIQSQIQSFALPGLDENSMADHQLGIAILQKEIQKGLLHLDWPWYQRKRTYPEPNSLTRMCFDLKPLEQHQASKHTIRFDSLWKLLIGEHYNGRYMKHVDDIEIKIFYSTLFVSIVHQEHVKSNLQYSLRTAIHQRTSFWTVNNIWPHGCLHFF